MKKAIRPGRACSIRAASRCVTSWLDARPIALAKMPEDTIMPLLLALALSAVFTGVLFKSVCAGRCLRDRCSASGGRLVMAGEGEAVHMSATADTLIQTLPWDNRRGTVSMVLFIVTEAMLFVALFFAYFYLGRASAALADGCTAQAARSRSRCCSCWSRAVWCCSGERT